MRLFAPIRGIVSVQIMARHKNFGLQIIKYKRLAAPFSSLFTYGKKLWTFKRDLLSSSFTAVGKSLRKNGFCKRFVRAKV